MVHLLCSLAIGATPSADVFEGIEPQRLLQSHDGEQARLLATDGWRRFARTDGAGWTARFDETTRTPRWAWGRGVPLPEAEPELHEALTRLLDRHADLFGFEAGTLRIRSSVLDGDTRYVELAAPRSGLDTWRGGISARIRSGNLVYLRIATAPDAPVTGSLALSRAEAVEAAVTGGPAARAEHVDVSAEPFLLERRELDRHELRTTWLVRSRTGSPVGRWATFVDGETGEILSVHNEVHFIDGTVTARHHRRAPDGTALIGSPLPGVIVRGASDSAATNDAGEYTASGSGPWRTDLDGQYLTVLNAQGGEGSLQSNGADLEWSSGDATQAEIDVYKFVSDMKAWGDRYAPSVSWVANPIRATVNLNQTCNAYWDGELHFFASGGGCNNTGQIADVVFHEWGHGFHDGSLRGGRFDGSLSEGAGDVAALLQTGDPSMAPHFFTNGGSIRELAPDRRYPQDMVGEVHENGLIFGGAMYDLLELLQDDLGAGPGHEATSRIYAGLLRGGPDIPDSFYEALVADDDDGDLENGTPHVCALYEAFGRHGLGTQGQGADVVLAAHDAAARVDPQAPVPVRVDLVSVAAGCDAVRADAATIHWRTGGGSWRTTSMSAAGAGATGEIPGQPAGTLVEYYVTGTADGAAFEAPLGGDVHPYTVYVGNVLPIRCDDFEADDGGYRHELLSGSAGEGADDWQWGTPAGAAGDPAGAYSGAKVWGNDLGQEGWNGTYQSEKSTRLESAPFDTAWYQGVVLSYRRWLRVEDAEYDRATIRLDGDVVWENHGSAGGEEHHVDDAWAAHTVELGGRADRRRGVRVAWDLASDGGLEFGGWTLDDVCLFAPATADNRLGIDDLRLEARGATRVALRWTQPRHAPVEAIRVVASTGGLPEGADGGRVVFESTDVALGRPVEIELDNYHPGTSWYAVYGFDGHEWLGWTIEGWNAGAVELVGGTPPDGVSTEDGLVVTDGALGYRRLGCGCDGAGVPGAGVGLAAAALALARRRGATRGRAPE